MKHKRKCYTRRLRKKSTKGGKRGRRRTRNRRRHRGGSLNLGKIEQNLTLGNNFFPSLVDMFKINTNLLFGKIFDRTKLNSNTLNLNVN